MERDLITIQFPLNYSNNNNSIKTDNKIFQSTSFCVKPINLEDVIKGLSGPQI